VNNTPSALESQHFREIWYVLICVHVSFLTACSFRYHLSALTC